MFKAFLKIATGRSHYAIIFLLIAMFVFPAAVFTDYAWLDALGWLLLFILGLFIFITGWVTLSEARRSFRWPRADAELISCSLRWHTSDGSKRYSPHIKCRFTVKGEVYQGTEFDFSAEYLSKQKAEAILDQVREMKPLLVHYKPEDPAINVIKPGIHFVHCLRLLLGSAMMVVSSLSWAGFITY